MFELDVTVPEHLGGGARCPRREVGPRRRRAPRDRLRSRRRCSATTSWRATWDDVAVALHISTYSLKALADAFVPLMTEGGSFVGLDFDNTRGLARLQLDGRRQVGAPERSAATSPGSSGRRGIRCNLVAAGPVRTMAAKSIPGFAQFEDIWDERAPLGWDVTDCDPGRQGMRRAAVGLVPGDHRRDRPRRRRLPLHRCRRARRAARACRGRFGRARLDSVNRLAGETSPYLRQHHDNPVDWYPWGPEAFAAAVASATCRSCCRSATPPATGAT